MNGDTMRSEPGIRGGMCSHMSIHLSIPILINLEKITTCDYAQCGKYFSASSHGTVIIYHK
jgi:hypothetical protein